MVRPSQKLIRKGFTLIEIMFALGLIALLATILFLGGRTIMSGAKERSTKVTLAALRGMLGEYDAKTRLGRSPRTWRWWDGSGVSVPTITLPNNTADFWRTPFRVLSDTYRNPDALDAPGYMGDEFIRNGSRQVLNTQLAMALLLQMPANRAALTKIPPEQYFIPLGLQGSVPVPSSYGVLRPGDTGSESIYFPAGVQVLYRNTSGASVVETRYICTNPTTPNFTGTTQEPPAGGNWAVDRGPVNPVMLDAWNNPIIFVPGTGLRVLLYNGKSKYEASDVDQIAIIVSPEGKVEKLPNFPPRVVQVGRPFFASAGPDGDFSKGDDNLYSFSE